MIVHYHDIFRSNMIEYIFQQQEVIQAKNNIDKKVQGSEYFFINITNEIRSLLESTFHINIKNDTIPMRWIKGDTKPHIDYGVDKFNHTYLIYLNDSKGELLIDNQSYPISFNTGYVFEEKLRHETINTGDEPRLLMGPMNENGLSVGATSTSISRDGNSTIYIKQLNESSDIIQYSDDQVTWEEIYWPCFLNNTNPSLGMFNVEFVSDIRLTIQYQRFVLSGSIAIGSYSLKSDGTRPIITIDGVQNYSGLIESELSYNHVMNLDVRCINGTTIFFGDGVICRSGYGRNAIDNYIINCSISGNTESSILGNLASSMNSSLYIINCSSSLPIPAYGGGIVGEYAGANGGAIYISNCWTTGEINPSGGGICGQRCASNFGSVYIKNCYSTGIIKDSGGGILGHAGGGEGSVVSIENCYSTGAIFGGGITGELQSSPSITNCYSLGLIQSGASGAGGIVGKLGISLDASNIKNCYVCGSVTGNNGFFLGGSTTLLPTCYSEAANNSSGWNDMNAKNVLTGTPTNVSGYTWMSVNPNSPYELRSIGFTPYVSDIIIKRLSDNMFAMKEMINMSIPQNSSTQSALINGKEYRIMSIFDGDESSYNTITINSNNGVITTTDQTEPGEYILIIRNTGSYLYSTVVLTVTPNSTPVIENVCYSPFNYCMSNITFRVQRIKKQNTIKF